MKKKHYYLLSALVIYQRDKLERTRHYNILVVTEDPFVNRTNLGRAQQQAQVRFYTEFDTERTSKVVDVFIQSVSSLGEMTEVEFHKGFDIPEDPDKTDIHDGEMADPLPDNTETEEVKETPVADVTDPAVEVLNKDAEQ